MNEQKADKLIKLLEDAQDVVGQDSKAGKWLGMIDRKEILLVITIIEIVAQPIARIIESLFGGG